MGKGSVKTRGFTLVEVIIVLVVLAILAAIMVPALTGWIDEAKAQICEANRLDLIRYYRYETTLYYLNPPEDLSLQKVMDGAYRETSGDVKTLTCPSGGTYTAVGNAGVFCSIHGMRAGMPQDVLISAMQGANVLFGAGTVSPSSVAADIDSGAPSEPATKKAAAIRTWLEQQGIGLGDMNVLGWKLQGTAGSQTVRLVTWTDQNLNEAPANAYVRVIRYDMTPDSPDKTYTVGYLQVKSRTVGGGTAYHCLTNAYGDAGWYKPTTEQKQFATYDEALAFYNTLDAKKQ